MRETGSEEATISSVVEAGLESDDTMSSSSDDCLPGTKGATTGLYCFCFLLSRVCLDL